MSEKVSTTALARSRDLDANSLFTQLEHFGYVARYNNKWQLTLIGEKFGGEYRDHAEFGKFIIWPLNLLIDTNGSSGSFFTATQLGEKLGLNAKKINLILNELGWIDRQEDGWHLTPLGMYSGGKQREKKNNSAFFIVWHDTLLKNKNFRRSINEFLGTDPHAYSTDKSFSSFQRKFSAKYRTSDGHYVRSKDEMRIDNWLYMAGLVHAYERKLPIEEELYTNFYLPSGRVYIQCWGSDTGVTSEAKKQKIRQTFDKHQFNFIELEKDDIDNLDELLPKALRQFGIKAY